MVAKLSILDACGVPGYVSRGIRKKLSVATDFGLLLPSCKNQSINFPGKLIAWFLFAGCICLKMVNILSLSEKQVEYVCEYSISRKAALHGKTTNYKAPFYKPSASSL